jgi:succinate dehydrogenase / fumarate reductase iron-sulfur subunit
MSTKFENISYRIRRFDPERDTAPHWEEYRVPYTPGMTVLEGLWKVKELHSPTLAWRSSCRMGVCG